MKPAAFRYVAADSVEEAMAVLGEFGDDVKVLAGGQSLLTLMNLRVAQPEALLDIGRCGLGGITSNGTLEIGAMTTQNAALTSSVVAASAPLLVRALQDVGHHTLRNRGTVGGSIAHGDPAAEIPAAVLALGGEMVVQGPGGQRTIAAADFNISHYTTALADDELLLRVRLPIQRPDAWAFYEIARRHGDFALAGVAATFALTEAGEVDQARLVLFAVDERPVRATDAEQVLLGRRLDDRRAIEEAAEVAVAAVDPVPTLHGGTEFRRRLAGVAVRRALQRVMIERRSV